MTSVLRYRSRLSWLAPNVLRLVIVVRADEARMAQIVVDGGLQEN